MYADCNTVEFWPVGTVVLVQNQDGKELWGEVDTARFPKSNPTNVLVVAGRIVGWKDDKPVIDGYFSFYPVKCEWVFEPARPVAV